jgi:SAM-dependent methyltransferase
LLPAKHECPCCGWQGRRFFDYIEMGFSVSNAACPRCDSHSRHRALFLWLRNDFRIAGKTGTALVFAPERAIAPLWRTAPHLAVYKIDFERTRGVDVLADLMKLPFASEVADLIWCHHVLEQVPEDRVALAELHRVCSPAGEVIVSAGISADQTTIEYGAADKRLSGNRRRYGHDFPERLRAAGFKIEILNYDLTPSERLKYGIIAESFYRCTRTS